MSQEALIDSLEYQVANGSFAAAAKMYVDEMQLPTDLRSGFKDFLDKLSNKIGAMFPQQHRGIGVSRVLDQAIFVQGAKTRDELTQQIHRVSVVHEFDCKLPSTFLVYVLREIFKREALPYEAGMYVQNRNAHVIVMVKPLTDGEEDCFFIDFVPVDNAASSTVSIHRLGSVNRTIEAGRTEYTNNPIKGMELYDQRYLQAKEEENGSD